AAQILQAAGQLTAAATGTQIPQTPQIRQIRQIRTARTLRTGRQITERRKRPRQTRERQRRTTDQHLRTGTDLTTAERPRPRTVLGTTIRTATGTTTGPAAQTAGDLPQAAGQIRQLHTAVAARAATAALARAAEVGDDLCKAGRRASRKRD